jgi:hypothetical protein
MAIELKAVVSASLPGAEDRSRKGTATEGTLRPWSTLTRSLGLPHSLVVGSLPEECKCNALLQSSPWSIKTEMNDDDDGR